MLMASQRRIHNFAAQHRVPSIEVYSTGSPPRNGETDGNEEGNNASPTKYIYYPSGVRNSKNGPAPNRRSNAAAAFRNRQQSVDQHYLYNAESPSRDFRILSSTLSPLTAGRPHAANNYLHNTRHGRISNSRSTGNLTSQDNHHPGSGDLASLVQKPVHHASSHGILSAPRERLRQDLSPRSTPSPTRRKAMQGRAPRRERTLSPYASFDDYNYSHDNDDEDDPVVGQYRDGGANTKDDFVPFNSAEPLNVLSNVIRPTTNETTLRRLELRYSARNDRYKRPTNPIRTKVEGWNSLVFAERNTEWVTEHCRIGEQEEVMTYLSRKPGTTSAYIEWKFDFSESGLRVKRCSLKFPFETFEDGHVRACLKATDSDEAIPIFSSLVPTNVPQIRGWDKFSLIAELACQREVCAFQHSQLFRQQLKSSFFDKQEEKYPFQMSLELYSMY